MDYSLFYREKKQRREKIFIFSFLNSFAINLFKDKNVDILRFDLDEFASLSGYKNSDAVERDDFLPLLKNLNKSDIKQKIAVDLPLTSIFKGNSYDIDKILKFKNKSNADFLVIDYKFVDLIKELNYINVGLILKAKNKNSDEKNKKYYEDFFNRLRETEINTAAMILSDFPDYFINEAKSSFSVPIVSNSNFGDGYYGKSTEIFGFVENDKKKYLNIWDLLCDGINDALFDILKK